MSSNVKEFGDAVRFFRKERKMSQEELAGLSGLHRTYIGSVERAEKNLTIKNVFKIAEALSIDPCDLFKKETH
ncbi:helix-turn-helix transcriptional regulator [Mycoplasmatota bacterium]|nr:helix-turn-helix transcriptional regulator [Mycoplasmatota bacterium]